MNRPVTTPSMLRNHHSYGEVEGTKYLDAFVRDQHESMAAGFKFGYWGQQKFSPHHVFTKPLRTCVGESPINSKSSYTTPSTDAYHTAVRRSQSRARRRPARRGHPGARRSVSPRNRSRAMGDTVSSRARVQATTMEAADLSESDATAPSPAATDMDLGEDDRRSLQAARSARPSMAKRVMDLRTAHARTKEELEMERRARVSAEKALVVERESRKMMLAEISHERDAREQLEEGLNGASSALERARSRIHSLQTQNQVLRRDSDPARLEDVTQRWRDAVQQLERAAVEKASLKVELRRERDLRTELARLLEETDAARKAADESAALADDARRKAEAARGKAQQAAELSSAVAREERVLRQAAEHEKRTLSDRLSSAVDRIEALEQSLFTAAAAAPGAPSPPAVPRRSKTPTRRSGGVDDGVPAAAPTVTHSGYVPSASCSRLASVSPRPGTSPVDSVKSAKSAKSASSVKSKGKARSKAKAKSKSKAKGRGKGTGSPRDASASPSHDRFMAQASPVMTDGNPAHTVAPSPVESDDLSEKHPLAFGGRSSPSSAQA